VWSSLRSCVPPVFPPVLQNCLLMVCANCACCRCLLLPGRHTFGSKVQLAGNITEYLFTNDLSVLLRFCLGGLVAQLTVWQVQVECN